MIMDMDMDTDTDTLMTRRTGILTSKHRKSHPHPHLSSKMRRNLPKDQEPVLGPVGKGHRVLEASLAEARPDHQPCHRSLPVSQRNIR